MTTQLGLELDTISYGQIITKRLLFPFLPPSKNKYDGWQIPWQHGHKKKWLKWVEQECDEQQVPRGLPKIGLSAKLIFPTNRRRDPQNYAATLWNFIPDGLQKAGVIDGDHAGKIDFGKSLGIQFVSDTRLSVPEKHREKTILAISYIGDVPK